MQVLFCKTVGTVIYNVIIIILSSRGARGAGRGARGEGRRARGAGRGR